jgi:hypothetical protein
LSLVILNKLPINSQQENQDHAIAIPTADLQFNVSRLFDPVQVKYIQSYEESALGKYYYWDLLGNIIQKVHKITKSTILLLTSI